MNTHLLLVAAVLATLGALLVAASRFAARRQDRARQAREAQIGRYVAAYLDRHGLGDTPPAETARSWARRDP